MPEAGLIPIPRKLAHKGVKDMVRISDGRMSGTAKGTVILHVAPESAAGGPLVAVQDGDEIELDADARTITLCISSQELESRLARWRHGQEARDKRPEEKRGWRKLYLEHVQQANLGADLDFLRPSS